ncbi:MAG: hypothetical protein ACYC5V_07415 [Gemmatimonadaceae bacterium]
MTMTLCAFATLVVAALNPEAQDAVANARAPLVVAIRAAVRWSPDTGRIGVSFEASNAHPRIPAAARASIVQEALGERGFEHQVHALAFERCASEECAQRRQATRIVIGRVNVYGDSADVTFVIVHSGVPSTVGPPLLTVLVTRENGVWVFKKLLVGRS